MENEIVEMKPREKIIMNENSLYMSDSSNSDTFVDTRNAARTHGRKEKVTWSRATDVLWHADDYRGVSTRSAHMLRRSRLSSPVCDFNTQSEMRRGGAPTRARPRKREADRRSWITGQSTVSAQSGRRPATCPARTAGR